MIKKILVKSLMLVSSLVFFSGCMKNENISRQFTAGSIGCKPQDISIVNETASMDGMHTWSAFCNNKEYFCAYHYGDGAKCSKIN